MVVGAHRAGAVAQVSLELHQGAIAGLLERLQLDPAAGRIHRPSQITPPGTRRADQIAQLHALALQLRPGLQHPVVVHPGQEVAPVLGESPGGVRKNTIVISSRGRRLGRLALDVEGAHVDVARPRVAPAQIPGRHDERRLIAQDLAKLMQLTAQVGQRLPV